MVWEVGARVIHDLPVVVVKYSVTLREPAVDDGMILQRPRHVSGGQLEDLRDGGGDQNPPPPHPPGESVCPPAARSGRSRIHYPQPPVSARDTTGEALRS